MMKMEKIRSGRARRDPMVNEKIEKHAKIGCFWDIYRYEQRRSKSSLEFFLHSFNRFRIFCINQILGSIEEGSPKHFAEKRFFVKWHRIFGGQNWVFFEGQLCLVLIQFRKTK